MISTKNLARVAGLLYLVVAVFGGFSQYVRLSLKVPGGPAATAAAISQHAALFRIAFITDLVDITCFLGVGVILYSILKSVDPRAALAMVALNAIAVAVMAVNMLSHLGALLVATVPVYTAGMSSQAASGMVLLLLDMHQQGYLVAQIFFGGYLLPLGYLVYRSAWFPKALGAILAVGGLGYVAGIVASYASPTFDSGLATAFGLVGGIAELMFLLWLLVRGANPQPAPSTQGGLSWEA